MKLQSKEFYRVCARPTVVISTISQNEIPNAAPFSWTSPVSVDPPRFGFSCSHKHDTWSNIMKNGEFVANFVGQQFGPLMHILEKDFPYETNEIEKASLTMEKSKTIRPPRIGEAYAWLECKMEDHLGTWVVGQVLEAEMKDKYAKNVVDLQKAKPLQHIYAEYFTTEMKIRRYKRA